MALTDCPKCGEPGEFVYFEKCDAEFWAAWYYSCRPCDWEWDLVCTDPYRDNVGPAQ